jgi:hypothetical protein
VLGLVAAVGIVAALVLAEDTVSGLEAVFAALALIAAAGVFRNIAPSQPKRRSGFGSRWPRTAARQRKQLGAPPPLAVAVSSFVWLLPMTVTGPCFTQAFRHVGRAGPAGVNAESSALHNPEAR